MEEQWKEDGELAGRPDGLVSASTRSRMRAMRGETDSASRSQQEGMAAEVCRAGGRAPEGRRRCHMR